MADVIINQFKVVQINEQESACCIIRAIRQMTRSIPFESAAIQYTGQRIGCCYGFHLTLFGFAVSNIDKGRCEVIADGFANQLQPTTIATTVVKHLEADPHFTGTVVLMTGALSTDPNLEVGPTVLRLQKPFRFMDVVPLLEGDIQH